jgi:predicted ArsR family transcriptional regulator
MSEQGDLFGAAYARRLDPDTSHDAAKHMEGANAGRMEAIVLEALCDMGGKGTAYQVEQHIGIDSNTVTPRFKPLENKKLIHRTDQRGPGRGSRTQIIWQVGRFDD